jgi:undecaprenyl-diphosphatase
MDRQQRASTTHDRPERRARPRRTGFSPLDGLYSTLRLIARHVHGFWTALVAFLGLGLTLGALLAAAFAALAGAVSIGFLRSIDERVLVWLYGLRSPFLDDVMTRLTTLGDSTVMIMIVLVSSTFLWLMHHRWSAYLLLAGVIGGLVVNNVLKLVFARPRPDIVDWGTHVSSASFPSGHAMSAIIVYGSVAYVVSRLEPTATMRRATWALAVLIILGIGISRMYLGVHYPTDIIAGFIAGAAWVLFVAWSARAARFFATHDPPDAPS